MEEFERAIEKVNINLYEVFVSVFHLLKKSYILDSDSSIYITKNKYRLFKYKPVSLEDKLKCKGYYIIIQSYKDLDIQFTSQGKEKSKTLQLFQMAYCLDFLFNIVSFQRLKKRCIDWSYRYKILIVSKDTESLKHIKKMYKQYVLKHRPVLKIYTAIVMTAGTQRSSKRPSRRQSKDIKVPV